VSDGREGYLLPPREPAAWAAAVRRIIESPDHGAAMGRAGRERVGEAFTAERHAAAIVDVYERAGALREV
jgi:D-inositol-3-phosphate glycosyltransferase